MSFPIRRERKSNYRDRTFAPLRRPTVRRLAGETRDRSSEHPPVTWEERWHPLREEWVIVAAHRQDRPWRGEQLEATGRAAVPAHDPGCHFCPGNARVDGHDNPDYRGVFAFDNDRPCVGDAAPTRLPGAPGFYARQPATGKIGRAHV